MEPKTAKEKTTEEPAKKETPTEQSSDSFQGGGLDLSSSVLEARDRFKENELISAAAVMLCVFTAPLTSVALATAGLGLASGVATRGAE